MILNNGKLKYLRLYNTTLENVNKNDTICEYVTKINENKYGNNK